MSKIEDALNKAKKIRNSISPVRDSSESDGNNVRGNDLVYRPNQGVSVLTRHSSASEIALMVENEVLSEIKLTELGIISSKMSDSVLANTFRDLRTKLIHKSNGKNFIVMITSVHSQDDGGKFALNLATAFTFDKAKTSLLIDCNLQNTQLDRKFKFNKILGLTDYLSNENMDIESIVQPTGIKRLRMIPAGTHKESSAEFFTSSKMRELMGGLLNRYSDRYIFINAAPVKDSADARILIDLCDYVILLVPYARSTKNSVKDAADAIDKEKLLGVVLNNIPKFPSFKFPKFGFNKSKA